jgi:hypothetical protein
VVWQLNYPAIFDEVQDFENNIRNNSGGLGLITLNGQTDDRRTRF